MQLRSVQRLPIPQFGQRFSPSVETANGLSRVAACRSSALAAKDQHDRQGEERDRADEQEKLGSLIHEVSLDGWCVSPRCRPRRTCEA